MAIKIDIVDFFIDKQRWISESTEEDLGSFLSRLQVANLKETLIYGKNLAGERMNMEKYLNTQKLGTFRVRITSTGDEPRMVTIVRAYNQ